MKNLYLSCTGIFVQYITVLEAQAAGILRKFKYYVELPNLLIWLQIRLKNS